MLIMLRLEDISFKYFFSKLGPFILLHLVIYLTFLLFSYSWLCNGGARFVHATFFYKDARQIFGGEENLKSFAGGSSDSVGGSEATKIQLHRQPKDDRMQTLLADNEKLQLEISALRNVTEKTESTNFTTLRAENERLKTQLEKVGLSNNVEAFNSTTDTDHINQTRECQEEQRENAELLEQLLQEQEEVKTLRVERESFLMTIQLLQEELTASEELRLSHSTM